MVHRKVKLALRGARVSFSRIPGCGCEMEGVDTWGVRFGILTFSERAARRAAISPVPAEVAIMAGALNLVPVRRSASNCSVSSLWGACTAKGTDV